MSQRQQLPPQIKKIEVRDRGTGKCVVRYQVTVDAGHDPKSGRRRQVRRRFATEAKARAELAALQAGVAAGTYVHASGLTVCQACDSWLLSKHALKPSTIAGHRVSLGPIRSELGHIEIQKLTKADLDGLIGRLRRGEVPGRKRWSARSVNYMLYLSTAVLDDQVAQGNAVRNVAKLVDRIAGEAAEMRTLTERDMFRILDHECRDRHLWALALYGLRRGEIAGLRWTNVDLKAKTVRIVENRVAVGAEIMTGTPKSKASSRTLPMPDEVVDVLRAHARDRLRSGWHAAARTARAITWRVTSSDSPIIRICSRSVGAGCSTGSVL